MKNILATIFYTRRKSYKLYYDFIQKARERELKGLPLGTYQQHHIVPKCWWKKHDPTNTMMDSPYNLVYLTVDEHITAHLLMAICIKDEELKPLMLGGADAIDKGFNHGLYKVEHNGNNQAFIDKCNEDNKPKRQIIRQENK